MSLVFGTGFAGVAWCDRDMEVPITDSLDTITGIASWIPIPTSDTPTSYAHFPMPTRFRRTSAACTPSIFPNSNLTPSGAESRLLRSSTEDVVTYPVTSIDNVKSKIHTLTGKTITSDHPDQWTLACALIDLASWVVLNGPQISQLLTICSNMEQSLTLEATLPAPPPPPQKTRQWKQHSPEPQQAVISRSWPSLSAPLPSQRHYPQHHQHHQQ